MGSGDLLEVRVFQESDLSGAYRVSPEGTIDFPLCGKVPMLGQTSSQAADALTQCLSQGFLRRPQVTVLIREYNSKKVFVFGEVQKPGTFPYDNEMSIIQAVTLAGGFTRQASKNNANVTRIVDGREVKIRVPVEDIGVGREKNFSLRPGDIVFVPESFF
jgi:polysaccharide export outer membrane protein